MATPNIKLVREGEIEEASGALYAAYVVTNPAWNKRLTNPNSHANFKALMQTELGADHIQSVAKGLKSARFYFEAISF